MATVVALAAWKKSEMALLVAMLVVIEREKLKIQLLSCFIYQGEGICNMLISIYVPANHFFQPLECLIQSVLA